MIEEKIFDAIVRWVVEPAADAVVGLGTEQFLNWLVNNQSLLKLMGINRKPDPNKFEDIYKVASLRFLVQYQHDQPGNTKNLKQAAALIKDKAIQRNFEARFPFLNENGAGDEVFRQIGEAEGFDERERRGIYAAFAEELIEVTFSTRPPHDRLRDRVVDEKLEHIDQKIDALQGDAEDKQLVHPTTSNYAEVVTSPFGVPRAADQFIGREELLKDVMGLLQNNQRVLLQGFGGEGKTAIASECTSRWLQNNPDMAVLWLDVGNVTFASLLENIALALGTKVETVGLDDSGQTRLLRQLLTSRNISMVVADDVWNPVTLNYVIDALPHNIPLLVTSRQTYSRLKEIEVMPMHPDEALDLLHVYVEEDYHTSEDAKICETAAYMAFAIEIAGRTMHEQGWEAERLIEEFEKVPIHELAVPTDLDRNVATLIQTSLNSLDEQTQQAFLAFGAFFVSTITPELMAWYLDTDPLLAETALQTLHRYGLAKRIPATTEAVAHFRIHDLGYSFARANNNDNQREQALTACLQYIGQYKKSSPENFTHLRPELDQFQAASQWSLQNGYYQAVQAFASWLYAGNQVLNYLGFYTRAIEFLKWAVQAAQKQDDLYGEANHTGNLGHAYSNLGQYRTAINHHEKALVISREIGDRQGEANHLGNLGIEYNNLDQYQTAIDHHEKALVISREIGDRQGEGSHLGHLGISYASQGRYEEAIKYYIDALAIAREIDNKRGEGNHLGNLANVHGSRGEYEEAISYYEQALAISREIGDRQGEGSHLGNLGSWYVVQGRYEEAIKYCEDALAISLEIGDRHGEGSHLGTMGSAYAGQGKYEEAISYYEQALAISLEIRDRHGEGNNLGSMGSAYAGQGKYEEAISYYEQALAIAHEIGDRRGEGINLGNLGSAYAKQGEYEEAISYYEQAMAIAHEIGDRRGEGSYLDDLGVAYASQGKYKEAIDSWEQALVIAREIGDKWREGSYLGTLGTMYIEIGDCDNAISHFNQSRVIWHELGLDANVEKIDGLLAQVQEQCR